MSSEGLPQTWRIILVSSFAAASSTREAGAEFCLSTEWIAAHGGPRGECGQDRRVGSRAHRGFGSLRTNPSYSRFSPILGDFCRIRNPSSGGTDCAKSNLYNISNTDSCQEGTTDTMLLSGSCNFLVCCNNVT